MTKCATKSGSRCLAHSLTFSHKEFYISGSGIARRLLRLGRLGLGQLSGVGGAVGLLLSRPGMRAKLRESEDGAQLPPRPLQRSLSSCSAATSSPHRPPAAAAQRGLEAARCAPAICWIRSLRPDAFGSHARVPARRAARWPRRRGRARRPQTNPRRTAPLNRGESEHQQTGAHGSISEAREGARGETGKRGVTARSGARRDTRAQAAA